LATKENEIFICLHKWGTHEHPTMLNLNTTLENGLILYFRTQNMEEIYQNLKKMDYAIEEEIRLNQNSRKKEFSVKDPDGYYLTISEFHKFEG